MASLTRCLPCAASVCFLLAITLAVEHKEVGNANQYIDDFLANLRKDHALIARFDPLKLPEFSGKHFQGWNVVVQGLSSIHRKEDCSVSFVGKKIVLSGELAFTDVRVTMNYKMKILSFSVKGRVSVRVESLAAHLDVSSTNDVTKLESFKVTELGKYYIEEISGMSRVLNWLLKFIANIVAKRSRGSIIQVIEDRVSYAASVELSKVGFPGKFLGFGK